jgi:hypothetical protein
MTRSVLRSTPVVMSPSGVHVSPRSVLVQSWFVPA